MGDLHARLREAFQWVDGHADVWRMFADPTLLSELGSALAAPFADGAVSVVAGVESRGFVLGPLVAVELEAGFVAVRKAAGLLPGPKISQTTAVDYRGNTPVLRVQRDRIRNDDRVLLVDDWVETGSQLLALADIVRRAGGQVVGTATIVNELDTEPAALGRVHHLIRVDDLDGPV